jgi:hypothetical protein
LDGYIRYLNKQKAENGKERRRKIV